MATPLSLEGDGLVENLFHYLWTTDDLGGGPRVSVPPTVIYRGSQPVAWYFTSHIVAYYLYLPKAESTSPAIEYYDTEALREFLFKRPDIPHSSTGSFQLGGILQQFALPKGSRNSTLRAIWSPKLCLLERRVNIHAIHDARFSVYERGVTFEEGGGAEALTRPEPVRGSMLPGMVQQLCERVVDHVTRVSYHKFRIARMVLRLQVDADDRLWLLWSSSLRLQPPLAPTTMITPDMPTGEPTIRPLDIVSDAKVPMFAFAQGSGTGPVSLSSTRGSVVGEEPRRGQTRCASCAKVVAHRALLPTTYKAVLAHFHHVLKFLREKVSEENQVAVEWPPDERVVQQAGGIGFGIFRHLKSMNSGIEETGGSKASAKTWQGRELLIPPVIRYLHPTLRTEDFARHRQDPIFLHKTVGVCERCCLVYADYATASLEVNALGIRSSASAPALLRPVREKPKHAEYFDDEPADSLILTTKTLRSPFTRGARMMQTKPPASAWKPVPTEDRHQGKSGKFKTDPRSTLHSLPIAPKLPPRIEAFESDDNDALCIPDAILHDDGSPQHQQQQREEGFFRELYQQKDTVKRGGHALRHILEAADRLSKAKPQHRLAALGNSSQVGQCQSTGALAGAISELKLSKKSSKSPYSVVQRILDGDVGKGGICTVKTTGNVSPAQTPLTQDPKSTKKKKRHRPGEASVERTRFISSREKRAAAAHRGYLVAALSDAQVQLEHIESLATLVISAPDIDVEPEQHDEQQLRREKNGAEEPHGQNNYSRDQVCRSIDAEHESLQGENLRLEDEWHQNLHQEEHHQKHELCYQEEHQRQLKEPIQEPNLLQKEQCQQAGEFLEQEQDLKLHYEGQHYLGSQQAHDHNYSHDEDENKIQHHQMAEDVCQDKPENFGHGVNMVKEAMHELVGLEDENHAANSYITLSKKTDNRLVLEARDGDEENIVQHEEQEGQEDISVKGHDDRLLENQTEHFDTLKDGPKYNQDEGSGCEQQQEQARGDEGEDEDEYEDEYEDLEREQGHHDQERHVEQLQANEDHTAAPAQNLLKQAHELLAAAASCESADDASDEHQLVLNHDGSNDIGDCSDHSVLSASAPQSVEDHSSDDSVIAVESIIASALPLPLSDESSSGVDNDGIEE
ncbi:unnamed protein product [Phytophthora fragariaefolia]|uniref:Unnamed protein product n=1 Tax=Phytophthora fragariaefolia TaxID=1490495 RepID=A0A9W7CYD5_9STRA|nr:unnamed protein product [Phytophthora fragariaefolia]